MGKKNYSLGDIDIDHILEGLGNRNIVLVGMMGCGKSTLGKILSKWLGMSFIDSDQEIERASGLSIREIIDDYGMDFFRNREGKVVSRILIENPSRVVALGGGSVTIEEVRDIVKDRAVSIWINPDLEVLVHRLKNSKQDRPLISGLSEVDLSDRLREIMTEREQYYRQSDLEFKSGDSSVRANRHCYEILERLGEMFSSGDK